MKKKFSVIFMAVIVMLSFAACSEAEPETITTPASDDAALAPALTPEGNADLDEPDVPQPSEPFTGFKSPDEFVKADSSHILRGILPHFGGISDIDLATLLNFAVTNLGLETSGINDEQRERLFSGFDELPAVYQIDPVAADELIQKYINPNFRIESYDYKNYSLDEYVWSPYLRLIWDSEENKIVVLILVYHSPGVYRNEIIDVYEEDGTHYVTTESYWYDVYNFDSNAEFSYVRDNFEHYEATGSVWSFNYNIYAFNTNPDGYFNVISKLPNDPPIERILIKTYSDECWLCIKAQEFVDTGRAGHGDGFDGAIMELGHRAVSVENFIEAAMNCDRILTAEVYKTPAALHNADARPMTEGELHEGMAIEVHFNPESYIQFMING